MREKLETSQCPTVEKDLSVWILRTDMLMLKKGKKVYYEGYMSTWKKICLYLNITMGSKKVECKPPCKFTAALCTIAKR